MAVTLAHFGNFCPHSNGMFFTIKDLILAERMVGLKAEFIDWGGKKEYGQSISRVGLSYGGITTRSIDWAMNNADIIVLHSALPKEVENSGKPIIVAMHGRPEYSFELERMGRGTCIGVYKKFSKLPQCKGFICFWADHIPQWELILEGKKITHVPAMVNLEQFKPDGPKFGFKNRGKFNIITTDIWREDETPFNVLMAAASAAKRDKDIRLHIFGLSKPDETSAFGNIINPLKRQGIIGECRGLLKQTDEIYRDADLLVTPHVIATRVVREALASGLPIVGGTGNPYTSFTASPRDIKGFTDKIKYAKSMIEADPKKLSIECRKVAEREFNLSNAGEAVRTLVDQVHGFTSTTKVEVKRASEPKSETGCKVQVARPDYRIHNFVAYCPGFEGKDLGGTYNKYMELIPDDDWACFLDHDAMFTTVNWYDQLYAIIQYNKEYSCFTAITNRIGNPDQRVRSLNQNCHDILQHRALGRKVQDSFMTTVTDITKRHAMSGVVMLVKKSAWKEAGGFKSGFLGVDNDFHIRLAKAGHKIGLAKGLYVYHVYRADGQNGLKPVEK